VWAALDSAHRIVRDELERALASACRLSINSFHVLVSLAAAGGTQRLTEVNRAIPLSQPSLSRLAARLEVRGLVSRGGDPTDGRGLLLTLTDQGAEVLEEAVKVHDECIQATFIDHLTRAEQRVLTEALGRIGGSPAA
jgi:DNA-binding MarR family transcriptional regulator